MTRDEIRTAVVGVLRKIAPEVDLERLEPDVPLRDQIDLDSMDVLNVMVGLDAALHVSVPESDYSKLTTLDGCVDYLASALADDRSRPDR